MAKEKKGFIGEFKAFISRGNVLDMAIGVIVAGAFGKITTSLVNDVLMPFIGWVIGDIDLAKLNIVLSPEVLNSAGEVEKAAVVLGIGTLLTTIIDFILVAFVVFLIVRAFNKAKERAAKKEAEEAAATPPAPPEPSKEEILLGEILEELRKK